MNEHPPGIVGVIAQDTARFTMFAASLTNLEVPAGTGIKWILGHEVAANTNLLAQAMFDEYPSAQWLWIMGDDHTFPADILTRLLDWEKDIVVPLCLTRNPPYKPVVFSGWVEQDDVPEGMPVGRYRRRIVLDEYPQAGLAPVHSAGTAGMLIRRNVFETLDPPWFEHGFVSTQEVGEDVYFCDKATEAGFEIYCDLDTKLGHCTTAIVWPVQQADGWTYAFTFAGGLKVSMPPDAWAQAEELVEVDHP